jgi:hypothetical protein
MSESGNIKDWDDMLPESPYLRPDTKYSDSNFETGSLNSDVIPKTMVNPYYRSQSSLSETTTQEIDAEIEKLLQPQIEELTPLSSFKSSDDNEANEANDIEEDGIPIDEDEDDDDESNVEIIDLSSSPFVKYDRVLKSHYHDKMKNQSSTPKSKPKPKSKSKSKNKSLTLDDLLDIGDLSQHMTDVEQSPEEVAWQKEMTSRIKDLIKQMYDHVLYTVDGIIRQRFIGDMPIMAFNQSMINDIFHSVSELERIQPKDIYNGEIYLDFSPDGNMRTFKTLTTNQLFDIVSKKLNEKFSNASIRHQTRKSDEDPVKRYVVRRTDETYSSYIPTYHRKYTHSKYKNNSKKPVKYIEKEQTILEPMYRRRNIKIAKPVDLYQPYVAFEK